ncbi:MAG: hypothetical protein HY298_18765 [Verrucomicrobia bacterium]|nr:hypothetical protein [Verrucomicrobiota bacterium]
MTPFIIVLATITAIVMLAAKSVEFVSAIIKYRKDNPTPTVPSATSNDSQKISLRLLWRAVGDLMTSFFAIGMVVGLMFFSGPATKVDVGLAGLAIIIYVSTLRSKPSAS